MENTFISKMEDDYLNTTTTSNGAIVYKKSDSALVDCNYRVSGWRYDDPQNIIHQFMAAFRENKKAALTWLFFLRDCRGGLGERKAFRTIYTWLVEEEPLLTAALFPLIAEYGRFDDMIDIIYHMCDIRPSKVVREARNVMIEYIRKILYHDIDMCEKGESISLLAKWMPSGNTSSRVTREKAMLMATQLGMSPREYRKTLSKLRKHLNVTEVKASANQWSEIDYESVPAKAALKYADAFLRHDEDRRRAYLKSVLLDNVKANISGINPYEILSLANTAYDEDVEAFYNAVWDKLVKEGFPDTEAFDGCLPIVDTSGSMSKHVTTKVTVRDIAFSLGLYFSQKANGAFHNKMMSFSEHPQWISVTDDMTLKEKYEVLRRGPWDMNTDIRAVFECILHVALSEKVKPEDMPKSLLIVSDMQFDGCVSYGYNMYSGMYEDHEKLLEDISTKYKYYGYKLPKLIFWSVTGDVEEGIPMKENENGLVLISGYSQNAAKAVVSNKKNPLDALMDVLNSKRYESVRLLLNKYI